MPNTTTQLESTVQSFVTEISSLVRVAALEAVASALGGSAPARRGPGRPKGSGAKPGRPARAGKRIRRTAKDLNAIAGKFLSFVKAHDGKRLEEISKGIGIASSDLKKPAQMLLAAKAVKTTGKKRGTMYHKGPGKLKV